MEYLTKLLGLGNVELVSTYEEKVPMQKVL